MGSGVTVDKQSDFDGRFWYLELTEKYANQDLAFLGEGMVEIKEEGEAEGKAEGMGEGMAES